MSFPMVALGKVVLPVERAEVPGAGTTYRQVGVKLWGVGAYERESMDGSQTRYKTLSRVEEDDIIVNKIWARNGSVALVPKSLAGCYVSGEFPTFIPIREKLEPRWFHWLTKTKGFWEKCDEKSQGTSGKNRIRPERFLEIEIPLPPLSEQRRIVARIEELAAKIGEARGLRKKAGEEIELLLPRLSNEIMTVLRCKNEKLGVLAEKKTGIAYKADDFSEKGDVPVVRLTEIITKSPTVYLNNPEKYSNVWLEEGDIILAKTSFSTGSMCMWPGPKAVLNQNAILLRAKEQIDQRFLFLWLKQQVFRYLQHQLADPNFYPYIREKDIVKWLVPIPPLTEQRRIVAYLDELQAKVDALRRLQTETGAELDALLPAVLDRAFKGEL